MARTLNDIRQEIYTSFLGNTTLEAMYGFSPSVPFESQFSKLSFEYNLIAVVAVAIWTFEQVLNIEILKLETKIREQKVHSTTWYSQLGKAFQLGYTLPFGETEYATIDEAAKVVKYCSVSKTQGGLRMKIAGESGGELAPIGGPAFAAFQTYMEKVKAAGDNLFYTNQVADDLKVVANIYYDPLILNANGERLDGTNNTPVQDAIEVYIKNLDFNESKFIPMHLQDALQQIEGVYLPELVLVQTKYALLPYTDVPTAGVLPDAGYVRLSELNLTYYAWEI